MRILDLLAGKTAKPGELERMAVIAAVGADGRMLATMQQSSLGTAIDVPVPIQTGMPQNANSSLAPAPWMSQVTILRAQAENIMSPEMVTININPSVFPAQIAGVGTINDVKARIQWGAGADVVTADVDAMLGASVTVLGNFVQVNAIFTAVLLAGVDGTPINPALFAIKVNVGATLSYGTRAASGIAPSWTTYASLAAAGQRTYAIPPFATSVSVKGLDTITGNTSGVCRIQFGTTTNAFNVPICILTQAADVNQEISIPGGAQSLTVINNGANLTQYAIRFGINL